MKTPDEIKKGLEACGSDECHGHHTDCPYEDDLLCTMHICGDARAYIQQLERERDAAVEDLETMGEYMSYCDTCLHNNTNHKDEPCSSCMSGYLINNWQWRCVQEGE